jgi:hypothetical protein
LLPFWHSISLSPHVTFKSCEKAVKETVKSVDMNSIVFCIARIGLQLPEGGDSGAFECPPNRNFDRNTKLDLTNELPLLGK